jgi:hypothetical protein
VPVWQQRFHADELCNLGFLLVRAVVALEGHIHDQVAVQRASSNVCLVALGADADKCLLTQIGHGFALASRSLLAPLNGLLVRGRRLFRALVLRHGDHHSLRAVVGRVGHAPGAGRVAQGGLVLAGGTLRVISGKTSLTSLTVRTTLRGSVEPLDVSPDGAVDVLRIVFSETQRA